MFKCRICSQEWETIPDGAIEIAARRRGTLYQFGGTVHDLRQHKPMSIEEHKHRKTPRSNCKFCNPITWAAEQTKLLQEAPKPNPPVEQPPLVQAPVQPQIMVEEVKPVAEIENEFQAISILADAFRRVNRKS